MGKKSKDSAKQKPKQAITSKMSDPTEQEDTNPSSSSISNKVQQNHFLPPPMEISLEEYHELQLQVQELTLQEAQEEWMDACRYGDLDVVRALAEHSTTELTLYHHPETHNTGLHMAAANGHVKVVQLLVLQHQHPFSKNSSGNTPLHWAAANGQADVVEFLTTQTIIEIDVLDKNDFGRSALTEGFTSQKEQVVKSLLEHDSATEEKLLSTGKEVDPNNMGDDNAELQQHVHSFFEHRLQIRELAMKNADNPFADNDRPDQDTTGLSIWSASLVMARWMIDRGSIINAENNTDNNTETNLWKDKIILELGSGCGVPGLAVAVSSSRPRTVYLTDLNPQTVNNLQYNIELNQVQDFVKASCMDWSDRSTWPQERVDYLLGSDLIYQSTLVPLLLSVIFGTIRPGGTFFYVAPDTGRDGMDEFIQQMKLKCPGWKEQVAPPKYHANPLSNGDDEECFLHFQELSSLTYMLYEFPIPNDTN